MSERNFTEWPKMAAVPALEPYETHIWRINLDLSKADESLLKHCLSVEEQDRASRFHHIRDRKNFLVRRSVLRHLLASYLGINANVVRLSATADGKPFVEGQDVPTGIRFNCSRSAGWALIAIGRGCELGVDLERHRPLADLLDLANTCFSEQEIGEFTGLPEALKLRCFFDAWTRKEAFVKAIGLGLSFALKDFSVSLAPHQPAKLLNVKNDHTAVERWKMQSLDVNSDYSAALVAEDRHASLRCFEWNS
jgi:4'-phosphopantetheinyl transferase